MLTDFLSKFLDSSEWQEIHTLLNETVSLSILWIVSSSGASLQKSEGNYPELCQLIRSNNEGLKRCKNSHHAQFQEVKRTGKPAISACYCGLLGFAMPLILDGEIIGVAGGCHNQSEFPITMEKCAEISVACDIDIKEIMDKAKKIKHIPKVEQRRLLSILTISAGMLSSLMRCMNKSLSASNLGSRYFEDLSALGEVCRTVYSEYSREEKLKIVLNKTRSALGADACSIYVMDQEELILSATDGLPATAVGQRIKVGDGIIGTTGKERQAIAVEDATIDPRSLHVSNQTRPKRRSYRSVLSVPLIKQDELVGVIDARTFQPRIWTQNEISLVSLIADHLTTVIGKS